MGTISPDEIDSSLLEANPPEPAAPEVFVVRSPRTAHRKQIARPYAGTGDPDPGAHAETRVPKRAGACRRERGDEPDTDRRANSPEFAGWRRGLRRRRILVLPPHHANGPAAQPTRWW